MPENEKDVESNTPEPISESEVSSSEPEPEATFAETLTTEEKLINLQEVVSSCHEVITGLQEEKAELVTSLQRSKADFDNFQKRTKKDRITAKQEVVRKFLEQLVPLLDNMGFALSALENADDSVKDPFFMLQDAFVKVLESHGVTQIVPQTGEPFNPEIHQAISVVSGDVEGEVVAHIARYGYAIKDQIFRPADVVVQKRT